MIAVSTEVKVESVDTTHPRWGCVLSSIRMTGNGPSLMLTADGFLSSRQTVLAAFCGGQVVGHASFRVEPARTAAAVVVDAVLDSLSSHTADESVAHHLLQTARARAKVQRCRQLKSRGADAS